MKKKLLVEGMSCGYCVNYFKIVLIEDIDGIEVLDVDLENKCVFVDMKDDVFIEKLKEVIVELGFELKGIE